MPFTPKFVDMVRNVTSTMGTGAVSLGSAVSGFTSLSDAVAAGEQFYYCIQGVDKPAEREVGRGTMQSNGTVARQPIGATATNFTTGTKTIALVAAAEWFAKIEAGGNGGTAQIAIGLTELAALATANGAAAILTLKGREGLFVFDSSNLAAKVTADPRKAMFVAPSAAPTGASGAWVRKYDSAINLLWFLDTLRTPYVTDDLPAFEAALAMIAALRVGNGAAGPSRLLVPGGRYYCSASLNLHIPVHLLGDGPAQGSGGTLIRFAKNINGIVVNHGTTHGDGTGTQGDATGSIIEGLMLFGGNTNVNGSGVVTTYAAGDSITGHGVRIRTTFVACIDVFTAFWGGDGININCTAGTSGATAGNANNFHLLRCQLVYNRGYGLLINGTDANAGLAEICSAISNGGGGIVDYSFLGNTHLQHHVRDCGKTDPIGSNGPVGACLYGGTSYVPSASNLVAASTTIPGTNSEVWIPAVYAAAERPWVSGLSWSIGAPYATNPANFNGRNLFMGCYAEGSQPPIQAFSPTLFVGGLVDEVGFTASSTSVWLKGGARRLLVPGGFSSYDEAAGIGATFGGLDGGDGLLHSLSHPGGNIRTTLSSFFGGRILGTQLNNSLVSEIRTLEVGGLYPTGSTAFHRLLYGYVNGVSAGGGRSIIGFAALADFNGMVLAEGDLLIRHAAESGDAPAYLVTTAGTYGAGAVVTPFAPLGLAEASTAELFAGVSSAKFISPARLFGAAAPVVVADGAVITLDGSTGINFNVTLGGNRTLANPTNMKPGQSGRIRVKQDATGTRTLAFGANWLFAGGDPTLSTAANAIDAIAYFANAANEIEASIIKGLS